MRTLVPLLGNSQKLDGGAMFGNAPKAMWSRWITADEHNRIPMTCRSLLVRDKNRVVLFEAGIGAFFDPAYKERYGVVEHNHVLLESLAAQGLSHHDVDCVVLSHLHFDHAGGVLSAYKEGEALQLLFPKALFVVGKKAFERAQHPHARDKASFISELPRMLEETGRLVLVEHPNDPVLGEGFSFSFSDGHTPGLLMTWISTLKGPVVYASDLIPGAAWVHAAITMGYDRYPEKVVDEKNALLKKVHAEQGWVFFTHDPFTAMARVVQNEQGKWAVKDDVW
jgi:glyoxylase-like metal-dependent hydrolase (beta-lactamase superfamily II)